MPTILIGKNRTIYQCFSIAIFVLQTGLLLLSVNAFVTRISLSLQLSVIGTVSLYVCKTQKKIFHFEKRPMLIAIAPADLKSENSFMLYQETVLTRWILYHLSKCVLPYYSGQSYKGSTIVNYNSRVVPDLKIPYITTLESEFTIVEPL